MQKTNYVSAIASQYFPINPTISIPGTRRAYKTAFSILSIFLFPSIAHGITHYVLEGSKYPSCNFKEIVKGAVVVLRPWHFLVYTFRKI